MELKNTTLDDLAAVIGFSATLRVSAWLGDSRPVHVPVMAHEDQLLVRLIGLSAASALSRAWGGQQIAIPRISQYDKDVLNHRVARLYRAGFSSAEIARDFHISTRRVQQILAELRQANLLREPTASPPQKTCKAGALSHAPRSMPAAFFATAHQ